MCNNSIMHVAFYPWFSLGHLTSFLALANKFAERGHKVSFFVPSKPRPKLTPQNQFPHHFTFIPITVPLLDGLPRGPETTNDVPTSAHSLIMTAMDMTHDTIETHLAHLKPGFVFYDFASWMPELGQKLGFKSVHYIPSFIAGYAYLAPTLKLGHRPTFIHLALPPRGFPNPYIRMQAHEAEIVAGTTKDPFGLGSLTFLERIGKSFRECDAIVAKTSLEMEGDYCYFLEMVFDKPVIVAGPMVPKPPVSKLDLHLEDWLKGFGARSVIYCAFGSECVLEMKQFQELVLGLELTGKPFLATLKPPMNCETIESALPKGYADRIRGKGIIQEGWMQQQLILKHPSVGCFITDCGAESLSEAVVSKCQVVMMPQGIDEFINARMMSVDLKIGVEVKKRENDEMFTKEAVQKAVSLVMEEESEVGIEVRRKHGIWRKRMLRKDLEDAYINRLIQSLQVLFE